MQLENWTTQATTYANWNGTTVATINNSTNVTTIRRFVRLEAATFPEL